MWLPLLGFAAFATEKLPKLPLILLDQSNSIIHSRPYAWCIVSYKMRLNTQLHFGAWLTILSGCGCRVQLGKVLRALVVQTEPLLKPIHISKSFFPAGRRSKSPEAMWTLHINAISEDTNNLRHPYTMRKHWSMETRAMIHCPLKP